jgi:putative heme-binding domain-containing protein
LIPLGGLLLTLFLASPLTPAPGLRVPPGFLVTEYSDSALANDIYSMTLDPRGRIVVAGRGYIRILVDDDGDGRADRAIPIADAPADGAQGMLWEGNSLFFSGGGGLRRYRMSADSEHALGSSELIRAARTGGEHESHAIKRGPDGWLYWLLGNSAKVDASFAQLRTSPIKTPVAGCVVRFTPDLKATEIVADGFRNAYDMDFNSEGALFTFDSDNERCVSLPWFEGTRFYHVIPGGHFGWLNPQRAETWRTPPYACDVVAPVLDLGRGSPTGVVCYRGKSFPQHYHDGFFLLDWTFGRIYFAKPQPAGSSYSATKEIFLECTGDNGFAPTAAVVDPQTGDLFIAIGGRGTRGAVYRVRYVGDGGKQKSSSGVLTGGLTPPARQLAALLQSVRSRDEMSAEQIEAAVQAAWNTSDRNVRRAAANLLSALDASRLEAMARGADTNAARAVAAMAAIDRAPKLAEDLAARLLAAAQTPELAMVGARVLQLLQGGQADARYYGTTWEGYSARTPRPLADATLTALRRHFPSGNDDVDRELTRALAMLQDADAGLLERVSQRWTAKSSPVEDIHYLLVFARLTAPRSLQLTARTAQALLGLDGKIAEQKRNRDNNWPRRIGELYAELARRDPELHKAMLANPTFGRPDHALFARSTGFPAAEAARRFVARASDDSAFVWNADLLALLAELPVSESKPIARKLWDQGGLHAPVLAVLAKEPEEADRAKFLEGLAVPQLETVGACVQALAKLQPDRSAGGVMPLVKALRRLPDEKSLKKPELSLSKQLVQLLATWSGQSSMGSDKGAWTRWFVATYPSEAARLIASDGVDRAAWDRRLLGIDWTKGDTERGRAVFQKASCAACHSGTQALGPDLRGVAKRFSRDDLFTAILQPSRDISPRYRTTQIITEDDKIYQGIIIYEAVDSLLLQTGPATTSRLVDKQIIARKTTDISLMPAGLIDNLNDPAIADLYAFLKSLSP